MAQYHAPIMIKSAVAFATLHITTNQHPSIQNTTQLNQNSLVFQRSNNIRPTQLLRRKPPDGALRVTDRLALAPFAQETTDGRCLLRHPLFAFAHDEGLEEGGD